MNSAIAKETAYVDGIYSTQEISLLDHGKVPKHVAIIMDGNRRWAKKNRLPSMLGHWKGAESITRIVRSAHELGIKILTVYAFSTENWMRSSGEIGDLMHLFKIYMIRQRDAMVASGVKLGSIGDTSRLPSDVIDTLEETKRITSGGDKIELVIALNYGGRDDIRRAAVSVVKDCIEGKLSPNGVSEKVFSSYLDTAKWQDPELLIRTGGEQRLSNFLLWQISYSEVYISPVLWPEFSKNDLLKAVLEYQRRERRMGGS